MADGPSSTDNGDSIWRKLKSTIFGEETSLRDQLEDVIERHEDDPAPDAAGDLTPLERQMVKNLLHFGERDAGEVGVPRADVIAVEENTSFADLVKHFAEAGHSRMPVYRGSLDEVIGMIHLKDVFAIMASDTPPPEMIGILVREPLYVPMAMGALDLLAEMRSKRVHLAIVLDEYSGTEGLVTIEDLIEEITGDIEDEHDAIKRGVVQREDGSLICQGDVPIRDLNREFGWGLPEDVAITIAGLVLHEARRIPEVGQTYAFYGFRFEILKREGTRIAELRIMPPLAIQAATS
jgi:CBS domain containing-hemolysin-like protein